MGQAVAENLFMGAIMAKAGAKSNRPLDAASTPRLAGYFSPPRSFSSLMIAMAWP